MNRKFVDTTGISEALGLTSIGVIEVELPEGQFVGGWDVLNDSEFKKEWASKGGKVRAKTLAEDNRIMATDPTWRAKVAATNKRVHTGNKHNLGNAHSVASRKKISENNGARGCRWMSKDGTTKRVLACQIDDHLKEGWQFGRWL